MSQLRLRHDDDGVGSNDAKEQRESLPFPVGWRDEPRHADTIAAELLDAAATSEELERTIEQMQQEIDELREELSDALHMPTDAGWRPPAA